MKVILRVTVVLFLFITRSVMAQDTAPFYVVIGSFKDEDNAKRFCSYAQEQNLPAVYGFNADRKIFYVYVRSTETKDVADDIRGRLRSGTVFRDAWIFNGPLSGTHVGPPVEEAPEEVQEREALAVREAPISAVEEQDIETENDNTSSGSVAVEAPPPAVTPAPIGRPFVFKLVDEETGTEVPGLVRLQENERASEFHGYQANAKVYVPAPTNRSGKWTVIAQSLGFRPEKITINYARPDALEEDAVGGGKELIIPIKLRKVRRGDYIEMENVKFFNNAAVFLPESQPALDALAAMMQDNADYEIRVHGHTNGDYDRDIVSIGESTDFFAADVSNQKSHGSAKDLSLLRAELVKAYLVQKGIDVSRITTKGEGGREMIYNPKGTHAALNDRVEVEIRKH